ncbi:MAG: 50S ribosomal protein L22 [Candidatus Omnitrophica bacterium]|nr:50S ribosomal protein L22 [Candidatus Omnitrophota bacterium]MDE2222277.1 50S ribosomal protein L22 [Candidatus Omnitrophota bacterium]
MIAIARGKYLRISSMKMRQVCDALRGKDVRQSMAMLAQIEKGASQFVKKVLDSAVSNAKQKGLSEEQLYIKTITANHGGAWKRFRAASFGRATPILRRTTHLTVGLDIKTK